MERRGQRRVPGRRAGRRAARRGVGGVDVALAFTAVAFALAALALAGIPRDVHAVDPVEPEGRAIAEGFRAVAADRGLRVVVGVLGVSTLVEGAIDVLVVLVALQLLGLGAAGVGWLNAAWGLGGAWAARSPCCCWRAGATRPGCVLASC